MEKNIILSFLSTIKTRNDEVNKATYADLDAVDDCGETHGTNESGLRYVLQELKGKNQKLHYYIALVSKAVSSDPVNKKIEELNVKHFEYIVGRTKELLYSSYYSYKQEDIVNYKMIPYEELANKDVSLTAVLKAFEAIKEFLRQGHTVNLYLDLSGGPRDANMLLLIITRLLANEEGVRIASVIYSNLYDQGKSLGQVQLITNAYGLLDLVSGAEEFMNYGRVDVLLRYFNKNRVENLALNQLLKSMKNFAEKIQVCHYDEFKNAIKDLQQSLTFFVNSTNSSLIKSDQERAMIDLLASLVKNIQDKYATLFANDMDSYDYDLVLIKWCFENSYIQQALTLITERMPIYFFMASKPLFVFETKKMEERMSKYMYKKKDKPKAIQEDPVKLQEWFYFWSISEDAIGTSETTNYKAFEEGLYAVFREILASSLNKKKDMEATKAYASELIAKNEAKNKCPGALNVEEVLKNLEEFRDYWLSLPNGSTVADLDESTYIGKFIKKCKQLKPEDRLYKIISDSYKNSSPLSKSKKSDSNTEAEEAEFVLDIFQLVGAQINKEHDATHYPAIEYCIEKGIYSNGVKLSGEKIEEMCRIARLYFDIKQERNAANHSRSGASYTELKEMMGGLIKGLENFQTRN